MCGIIAYTGHQSAQQVILKGLKRLEYRGYDSAGMALYNGGLIVRKSKGKVSNLETLINGQTLQSHTGLGHTRWATHGEPSDRNAHPHCSSSKKIAIVHNGIIENYSVLKKELLIKGYTFQSDTDTEVIVQFIEYIKKNEKCNLETAVKLALAKMIGAYAIVVMSPEEPNRLIAAKKGSPLVIGVGKDEFFIASDASPIVEYTNEVIYLNDNEIATVSAGQELEIKDASNLPLTPYIQTLNMELKTIEKGGYKHFMLKEIFEQPTSVEDCMRGRLDSVSGNLVLGGLGNYIKNLVQANRILIVACGTSWHAGLTAEYFFEEICRVPVEVEYASEFRYRNPVIRKNDVVIAISQSGETADTCAAVELAKSKGAVILGVCNVVGASIPRKTHAGIYTHAGPEIGVASTKAFTAQLIVLYMMALHVAQKKGTITTATLRQLLVEMRNIPQKISQTLQLNDKILAIAHVFKNSGNFIYLGRGYNFPVALEGALKLKEISYIHAEGYPAAEMKHGPIALIDEEMPVVVVATKDNSYDKIVSNIQEVKARKGRVILITTEGDKMARELSDYVIEIPSILAPLTPLIAVIPLQLLSYHIAVLRNCNVDQPRNLAKSVTVE